MSYLTFNAGVYVGWRCAEYTWDCIRVGENGLCFCGHLLKQHQQYNGRLKLDVLVALYVFETYKLFEKMSLWKEHMCSVVSKSFNFCWHRASFLHVLHSSKSNSCKMAILEALFSH